MLTSSSLAEEGAEGVIASAHGFIGGHMAIGLDAVLQAVKFPAGIADLDTSLANVNRNAFPLEQSL